MVGVTIDSGPIGISNDYHNTPREQWPALVEFRRDYIKRQYGFDCRSIVEWLNESDRMWRELGYQSLDEMVRKGLEIDPADARLVAEWLRRYKPDYPVGLPDAINYALGEHGTNRYTKSRPDNCQVYDYGNSSDYTHARLQRDNPVLYERVRRGELSAHAAAIEAGWRKPHTRYSLPADPQAAARYLAERVDKEWIHALVTELELWSQ